VDFAKVFGAFGDFQNKLLVLSNRNVSGKSQSISAMRTIEVKLKIGWKFGISALIVTGKRKTFGCEIKAIRTSWEMAVRNVRPCVTVVTSIKERLERKLFVSGIIVNERNGALLACISVGVGLVIFGLHAGTQYPRISYSDCAFASGGTTYSFAAS
jgi:hypothetical protein